MTCPETIDRMDLALEERLPPTERPVFHDHIGACAPCRKYYEQLGMTVRTLRALPQAKEANPRRDELVERFRRSIRPH